RSPVGPRFFGFLMMGLLASRSAYAQQAEPTPTPPGTAAPPSTAPAAPRSEDLIPPTPTGQDGMPAVDPAKDQQKLIQQGRGRPTADGTVGSRVSDVYSEDWWAHTRPILELHGYFRTRGELFHNFALSRHDGPDQANPQNLWAQPLDNTFTDRNGQRRQV